MSRSGFRIQENDPDEDIREEMFARRGCCSMLTPSVGSVWWQRIRTGGDAPADDRGRGWWIRGWLKLREWSELVAGPRWKTFIRRIRRNRNPCAGGADRIDQGRYRYDPLSYALNFDDGDLDGSPDDDGYLFRTFSSRYAQAPSSSAKCSMDFDNDRHAPNLV